MLAQKLAPNIQKYIICFFKFSYSFSIFISSNCPFFGFVETCYETNAPSHPNKLIPSVEF